MVNALYMDDWTVSSYEMTEDTLTIEASYDIPPSNCPKCGVVSEKFYKHGPATVTYTDAPTFGKCCTIKVATQRLRCLHCRATFMQPLPDMADGYMITKRCMAYIVKHSAHETWASIARNVGIEEKTVRSIARSAAEKRDQTRTIFAPLVLGIDELRLDGELRAIFVDGGYRRVLDILPSNEKYAVNRWMHFLQPRERIRVVTMDMYGPYRDIVQHLLPNAQIIVDRWHVQKRINEALDRVRVRTSRAQRTRKAKMAMLRKRKLLQISKHKLKPHVLVMLQAWLANNPVLMDAWCMKEAFYEVWESKSAAEAEEHFNALQHLIIGSVAEEFGPKGVYGTIDRWRSYIFPYFDMRFTNAYTEAANGIIKIANRAGRGYGFEQIRAKALAPPRPRKKQLFVCEQCLKRFPASDKMFFMFGITSCPECWQPQLEAMLAAKGHSTLTSE
jgi:transposase